MSRSRPSPGFSFRISDCIFLAALLAGCSMGAGGADRRAASLLKGLTTEQKVGQLFMVSISGSREVAANDAEDLRLYQPGALILFGFNVAEGAEATRALTASAQDCLAETPVPALVAIDHEGGTVYRFADSLTKIPSAKDVADRLDLAQTTELGRLAGSELRALGISLNLAPIAEPSGPWNSLFLGSRAYSADPRKSANYAAAFAKGMRRSRVASTLKHFPGNAQADPHKGLPILDLPAREIQRMGVKVFGRAISRSGADCVMLSHVMVPALDPALPASLSPAIVSILRKKLKFKGIILTDDLEMRALSAQRPASDSALMALRAGADMLLVSSRYGFTQARGKVLDALAAGSLSPERLDESVLRVLKLKLSLGLMDERDAAKRKLAFGSLALSLDEGRKFVNDHFRRADNEAERDASQDARKKVGRQ